MTIPDHATVDDIETLLSRCMAAKAREATTRQPAICKTATGMAEPSTSSAPVRQSPSDTPKVIYVMGAGRSGSTILGVTLGNCENVFYAGELDKWLVKSGVPQLDGAERTQFWNNVREDITGAEDLFGGQVQQSLERSSALFRVRRWPVRRRLRPSYRRVTERLYRAVARATGVTNIVDTSHYPLRARELQALSGIELYLLFLIRDPQRVVSSFDRRDVPERRFGIFTTNAYLWLTYLVSTYVFLRHPRDRRLLVRYEDFVANPERVLRDIVDLVDGSGTPPDFSALRTGFPFQGNRLIRSDVIALESAAAAPKRTSWITALLQLPLKAMLSRLRPTAGSSAFDGKRTTSERTEGVV
jgi:hypothetical protein